MEIILCYLCIYIVEALILWQYCSAMFLSKHSPILECCSAVLFYIIPFLTVFHENFWINTIIFLIANLFYILFIYKTDWSTAFFHATITTIIMTGSELVVVGLISNLAYDFYAEATHFRNLTILAVLSKLLYFFILQVITYIFGKNKQNAHVQGMSWIFLTMIPFISLFIVHVLTTISVDTQLTSTHDRIIAVSALLLLLLNVIIFGIYHYNQKKSLEFTQLQIQVQKESDSAEYYKMLNEQHENQSILIHDIKKHLNTIALLNAQGASENVATYINQIISSPDLQESVRICDNQILNLILNRYLRICRDTNILFRTDVRSNSLHFLQSEDLTALISNLLDNALEACAKKNDTFIELHISPRENSPFTVLTLTNSCRTNPFSPKTGKLITRKKDSMRHGYGIKSIKRIVKKYNGEIQMYYDEETLTFHTIIALKKASF